MKQATWMATNGIVAKWESNHGEDDPLVRGDRLIYQQDDHEQVLAHFTGQK